MSNGFDKMQYLLLFDYCWVNCLCLAPLFGAPAMPWLSGVVVVVVLSSSAVVIVMLLLVGVFSKRERKEEGERGREQRRGRETVRSTRPLLNIQWRVDYFVFRKVHCSFVQFQSPPAFCDILNIQPIVQAQAVYFKYTFGPKKELTTQNAGWMYILITCDVISM